MKNTSYNVIDKAFIQM